jgi:hypothetical protein
LKQKNLKQKKLETKKTTNNKIMNTNFSFLFLLFSIFCAPVPTHAQTTPENLDNFTTNLQKKGFSNEVVGKIKKLILARDQGTASYEKQRAEVNAQYPINMRYDEINNDYILKEFSKSLAGLLTIEQYKTVFAPQLAYRVAGITEQKMKLILQKYKLTTSQELQLKNLVRQNTLTENVAREYHNYDGNTSWNKYTAEKLNSFEKECLLMQSFGIFYTKNTKTDTFITQLQHAKVDQDRINAILKALQTQDQELERRGNAWIESDAKYLLHFYDDNDNENTIRMDFRAFLQKTLTIDEFKAAFLEQFQVRITRDANKELQTNLAAYTLTPAQTQELKTLILAKITEKAITQEYYKHSWELAQQKLRAVEYRHEKSIREWLATMPPHQ